MEKKKKEIGEPSIFLVIGALVLCILMFLGFGAYYHFNPPKTNLVATTTK